MHDVVLIKLVGCVVTAVLASAIFARDSAVRIHRLMAAVLASASFWALCEVLWSLEEDPEIAVVFVRLSSLGWVWLGPVVFDIFLELGRGRSPLLKWRRTAYWFAIASLPLYVFTPWGVESVQPVEWGWSFRFGPIFMVPYLAASLPPLVAVCCWRQIHPATGSRGERRVSNVAFFAVASANLVTAITDIALPLLGLDFPPLGSTSISLACLTLAWALWRYGYTAFAPSAVAEEILKNLSDGIAILESNGSLRASNEALERLAQASPARLDGVAIQDLLPGFSPGCGTRGAPVECEFAPIAGERFPVSVTSSLLYHDRGHVLGEVVVVRDLREIEVLRGRLVNSGRLAAVGELSTSIAHEIRDPVADVRSHLSSLRLQWEGLCSEVRKRGKHAPLDTVLAEGEELIDECLEGVDRVASIVRDVGGFAPGEPKERESTDLNRLVEDALRIARSRAPQGVSLECTTTDIPRSFCNPAEITQVLLNLLLNAIQAVGEGGSVVCSTACRGETILIRVRDDGCGIPADVRERIFDPFFTTKPVGEGTGLGLAISVHIVRAHDGDIQLESVPSEGTSFTIELPAETATNPR